MPKYYGAIRDDEPEEERPQASSSAPTIQDRAFGIEFVGKPPPGFGQRRAARRYYIGKEPPPLPAPAPRAPSPGPSSAVGSTQAVQLGSQHFIGDSARIRKRQSTGRSTIYRAPCTETREDNKLRIRNETIPENPTPGEVPVRLLKDFAIYDYSTRCLVSFEEVIADSTGSQYGASGIVEAWIDEDDSDEVEDEGEVDSDEEVDEGVYAEPQRVCLSQIQEVSVHHVVDETTEAFRLNPRVYICTSNAWYILEEPSEAYIRYFSSFWIKHTIFHEIVTAALLDDKLTPDELEETLAASRTPVWTYVLPGLHECLVYDDVRQYVAITFAHFLAEHSGVFTSLRDVPAVAKILKVAWSSSSVGHASLLDELLDAHVLEKNNRTAVTPNVHHIAKRLFPAKHLRQLPATLLGDSPMIDAPTSRDSFPVHGASMRCRWVEETETIPGFYDSVIIDGVHVQIGDTVLVEVGVDAHKTREKNAATPEAQSGDPVIDSKWFVKICYMYEEPTAKYVTLSDGKRQRLSRKMFHGQWYQHGSRLLLQEMAHPRALYLLDSCDSMPLDCIYQKCSVTAVEEMSEPAVPSAGFDGTMHFPGLIWDQTNVAFRRLWPEESAKAMATCEEGKECLSCGLTALRHLEARWTVEDGHLSHQGVMYHIDDYVYVRPDVPPPSLYVLAQVTEITRAKSKAAPHKVQVRLLERYDTVVCSKWGPRKEARETDERMLVLTDEFRVFDMSRIEGKFYVSHPATLSKRELRQWLEKDDHFLLAWRTSVYPPKRLGDLREFGRRHFVSCDICTAEHSAELQEEQDLLKRHGRLRCMDLFAGAGGLSVGLHQSGFVQTKWAVELMSSAANSFAKNNPTCIVYNQCSNVLLQHAVDTNEGRDPEPLPSRNKKDPNPLPPMPMPGEVDMICGGPPCQSFSGANRLKKVDDIRTTLVCNMLSYVDFYRPKYVLLENVIGLLFHRLECRQESQETANGVTMSVVKFVFRTLTSLGYQVHCKVLQAAQYGTPQARERVIFWAARYDVPLPEFPVPTHNYGKGVRSFDLPTREILHRPVRVRPPHDAKRDAYMQYAPFRAVTVEDAISDLPWFDWLSPYVDLPMSERDKEEGTARVMKGIQRISAVISRDARFPFAGWSQGVSYRHKPLNRYQQQARKGLREDAGVYCHYTTKFSAKIVERVVNIPLRAGASHVDLPVQLRDPRKLQGNDKSKKDYQSQYKRLDRDGQFRTMMTSVKPNGMNGSVVLHPTQKRILTVRECARAQGFPDSYEFLSPHSVPAKIVDDQMRQIGNAVPIPLALALGKELGKALVKLWKHEEECERAKSPEVPMEVDEDK